MDALVSKISLSPPVTSHRSPITGHSLSASPGTSHQSLGIQAWINSPGISYQSPVTGHPVTGHPGKDKITRHLSRVLVSGHCDGLLVTPTGHQL